METVYLLVAWSVFLIQEFRIIRIKASRNRARMWRNFHATWSARWEAQARSESLEVERLLKREIDDFSDESKGGVDAR